MKRKILVNSLFEGILFLIIGVVLVNKPELVVILISYVLGTILVLYGIGNIIYYSYQKGKVNDYSNQKLILGITIIIVGLICIFLSSVIEQVVRYLIGAYLVVKGIKALISIFEYKTHDKKMISIIIVSALLLGSGLNTIFNSNLIISGLGIILIIYGFIEIYDYIFCRINYKEISNSSSLKVIEVKEKKK